MFQFPRHRAQVWRRDERRIVDQPFADRPQVDACRYRREFDPLAIGGDARAILLVHGLPELAQRPAERAARIVGEIPEHFAKPLAADRARDGGKIAQERTRLA